MYVVCGETMMRGLGPRSWKQKRKIRTKNVPPIHQKMLGFFFGGENGASVVICVRLYDFKEQCARASLLAVAERGSRCHQHPPGLAVGVGSTRRRYRTYGLRRRSFVR